MFYVVGGHLRKSLDVGEQLLRLAHRVQDPLLFVVAHYAVGVSQIWLGELDSGQANLDQCIAYYVPEHHLSYVQKYGSDIGPMGFSYAAIALWLRGYRTQAVRKTQAVSALNFSPFPAVQSNVGSFDVCVELSDLQREARCAKPCNRIRLTMPETRVWYEAAFGTDD